MPTPTPWPRAKACLPLLALVVACQPPPAEMGPLSDAELAEVRSSWDAIGAAERAADFGAVTEYLTEDFVHMDPRAPTVRGREAWRTWAESLELGAIDVTYNVEDLGGSGDMAYAMWSFTGSWTEAGEPRRSSGKGITVFRRGADGVWRASRNAWNADPAQ